MTEPIAYLKGEFIPFSRAALPVSDLGVIMGATFTEMTRTFRGEPFRAEDHIARLFASLKYGGIALPLAPSEVLDITREVVEQNYRLLQPDEDLAVVQFVTPGENSMYSGGSGALHLEPTFCVHTFRLPFGKWKHLFQDGAYCVTPSVRHIPPQCVDPKTKNRSRLHWWLAEREAHQTDPRALSLLLDLDGNITECAGANFLIARDRTIYSPTSRNILGGISLQTVRELSAELGYKWIEKDLQLYDVPNADEAWLTTTPYCMAPCTRINGIAVGHGEIGPMFREVLGAWSTRVGVDIQAQILKAATD